MLRLQVSCHTWPTNVRCPVEQPAGAVPYPWGAPAASNQVSVTGRAVVLTMTRQHGGVSLIGLRHGMLSHFGELGTRSTTSSQPSSPASPKNLPVRMFCTSAAASGSCCKSHPGPGSTGGEVINPTSPRLPSAHMQHSAKNSSALVLAYAPRHRPAATDEARVASQADFNSSLCCAGKPQSRIACASS